MSRYPGAVWRPVAYTGLHARQPHKAMVLHTNGGGAQLYGWWQQKAKAGEHIGAQYQVFKDGRAECYVDPDLVVYHAYSASEWAIGVETEDDGHPDTPWTLAQIQTIAAIGRFHGIPAVMLNGSAPSDGVGYHQQHPEWNQSAHDCPGHVRVVQIPQILAAMQTVHAHTDTPPTPVLEEPDMRIIHSPSHSYARLPGLLKLDPKTTLPIYRDKLKVPVVELSDADWMAVANAEKAAG